MDSNVPGLFLIFWKGAGVAFLAVYALRRVASPDGRMIAAVMAFGALGDMLIEIDLIAGAGAFLVGHAIAIALYARHRRETNGIQPETSGNSACPDDRVHRLVAAV